MFFLNPWALWGLAATAIPILLHLERNRGAKLAPFPTIRFLEELQQQRLVSLHVQEWLLLLFRLLLVVLIVAACSAPRFSGGGMGAFMGTSIGRPQAVGMLVDVSPSMDYQDGTRTLRQAAVDAARRLIDDLPPGLTLVVDAVGSAREQPVPVVTTNSRRAVEALREFASGTNGTPVEGALNRMVGALAGYGQSRLVVITDLQQSAWEPLVEARDLGLRMRDSGIQCTLLDLSVRSPANLWIDTVDVPPLPRPSLRRYVVNVSIAADAAVATSTQPVRVELMATDRAGVNTVYPTTLTERDGVLRSSVAVSVGASPAGEADEGSSVVRRLRLASVGERRDDPLPADNELAFEIPIAAPARVLLVSPAGAGLADHAVQSALQAGAGEAEGEGLLALEGLGAGELARADLAAYDVLVVPPNAGAAFGEAEATAVVAALRAGVGLLWAMPVAEEPTALGRALGMGQVEIVEGDYRIRPAADRHPLTRTLTGFPESAWEQVHVRRLLRPARVMAPLYEAFTASGTPLFAVAEFSSGEGRAIVLPVGLETGESNLAVMPQFVALLHEAVIYLGADETASRIERACSPQESRLTALDGAQRRALALALRCDFTTAASIGDVVARRGWLGLWPEQILLLAAVACLLGEAYIANRL